MKRVKIMLSAILVMAIVAGALAFKVKSSNVCAYNKAIANNPPATTECDRTHAATTYVTIKFTPDGAQTTQYARTLPTVAGEEPCPSATTVCTQSLTLAGE